jgi:hypothetical protein
MRLLWLTVALISAVSVPAFADEQMETTAASGSWIAGQHSPSETDPPDVCMAFNVDAGVGLRSDGVTTTLRVINDKWSLPDDVQGSILITIGAAATTLEIADNTNNMVEAVLDNANLPTLLDGMAKASSMQLKVGKDKAFSVSLAGSTVVLNAFRTCAGIGGSAAGGGSNPFQ